MRGRLIFPHTVRIARIDPEAIEAAGPGGAGGMDDDFREPLLEEEESGRVVPVRRELAVVELPAQVEPGEFDAFVEVPGGSSPRGDLQLTLHFRDLEAAGLVGDDGGALLRAGDRLVSVVNPRGGELRLRVPLYIATTTPDSWGFGGGPNLLVVTLTDRPEGSPVGAP